MVLVPEELQFYERVEAAGLVRPCDRIEAKEPVAWAGLPLEPQSHVPFLKVAAGEDLMGRMREEAYTKCPRSRC